ncbi:MAG: hypothetical protein LBI34_01550 [Puniceicoccales bacterium]|jgi:transketolase|nr:hypothetical protein [Puniceicoccales bacterium]
MDCEHNCGTCSECDIHGSCAGLAVDDGEILTQIAAFGGELSRKLFTSISHSGHASNCLRSVLFGKFLRILPSVPCWIDRDRFVVGKNKISSLFPWLYLAGFPMQMGDIIFYENSENIPKDFQALGIDLATKSPITKAVDVAISHKKMILSLREHGIPCLSKVLSLAGNISSADPAVMEALQCAIAAKLDNLILISEGSGDDNSILLPISDLRAIGFHIEEIESDGVQAIYEKLIQARINGQQQPQIVVIHGRAIKGVEIPPTSLQTGSITDGDFFIPDAIHNYFALLNMRKNSDYENWQYRFECAVDFHPEILHFVESRHAY